MSDTVIKVENLSKQYRLGLVGTGTLSHDLNRFWARVRGKEDPYARIGDVNDRTTKTDSDYVWALNDINFEVKKGEVLGIIGKNGAGKSTLLKILSRVTTPTTGSVKMKGRVGSLLEVGTGFHPELTGRDNIYLNGAILGMRKWEIDKKLDEIVDFSGVERYLDTPVKRYSSGMKVRLGFAVAAHLEPEILIVDEVLAVGDAEFQKKCLGKMQDVSKNDGRTILFVSHNLASVSSLCQSSILMENGHVAMYAFTQKVLSEYQNEGRKNTKSRGRTILNNVLLNKGSYDFTDAIVIKINFNTLEVPKGMIVNIICYNNVNEVAFFLRSTDQEMTIGNNRLIFNIKEKQLMAGDYTINVTASIPGVGVLDDISKSLLRFEVLDQENFLVSRKGHFYPDFTISEEV